MSGIIRIISSQTTKQQNTNEKVKNSDLSGYWFSKQLDNFIEGHKDDDRRQVSKDVFYASCLGNPCDRYLYLHYNGLLKPNKISANLQRSFDNDRKAEERYLRLFEKMRILVDREIPARIESPPIHGRADFILTLPQNNIKRAVLELKTANDYIFKHLNEPKPDHFIQIQTYLNILLIDQGIVLYENRNDGDIRSFLVNRDQNIWDKLVERCKRIQTMIEIPELAEVHNKYCECLNRLKNGE